MVKKYMSLLELHKTCHWMYDSIIRGVVIINCLNTDFSVYADF